VVEFVETKTIPACKETLEKITENDIHELFRQLMRVEKYGVKKGKLEIVYVHRLNEFTKKRIKLRLEHQRSGNEIVVRGKGDINVELVIRCSRDNEVAIGFTVYGKAEKYIARKQVEDFVKKLLELIESKAPKITPTVPVETPSTPQTPVALARATPKKQKLDCETRLFTAGLTVDENLSKDIPVNYHPMASTSGRLIEDGVASVDILDFSMYVTNHDIRIIYGNTLVESVRLRGERVGIYYRNYAINEEAFGKEALEKAKERICREGVEISYLVIELPQ